MTAAPAAVTVAPVGAPAAGVLSMLHGLCFSAGWSVEAMAALLSLPGTVALVATADDTPLGMAIGRCAVDEAEVLTIATLPDSRRRGIGRLMLANLLEALQVRGADAVFLEVDELNDAAKTLYDRAGFVPVGRRRGYYRDSDGVRDALILRRGGIAAVPVGAGKRDSR